MNSEVDKILEKAKRWKAEMKLLQTIVLDCGLTEEKKWYQACYTLADKNIVIVSSFKNHCILGFFKGALIKDDLQFLIQPGEHSQSGRQMRFTSVEEILQKKSTIIQYIFQAIEIEKSNQKIELKKITERPIPAEFEEFFLKNKKLKNAFHSLTPGRQRAYLLHFSSAKQSETRSARIEKCVEKILEGRGINE